MIQIVIPGDVAQCSPNAFRRLHWREQHRRRQEWKTKARLLWLHNQHPTLSEKVRVDVVIRRGRRLDADNAVGSLKGLLDGLKGLAYPDDSETWLTLGQVKQEIAVQWRGYEEVVVSISPFPVEGPIVTNNAPLARSKGNGPDK